MVGRAFPSLLITASFTSYHEEDWDPPLGAYFRSMHMPNFVRMMPMARPASARKEEGRPRVSFATGVSGVPCVHAAARETSKHSTWYSV